MYICTYIYQSWHSDECGYSIAKRQFFFCFFGNVCNLRCFEILNLKVGSMMFSDESRYSFAKRQFCECFFGNVCNLRCFEILNFHFGFIVFIDECGYYIAKRQFCWCFFWDVKEITKKYNYFLFLLKLPYSHLRKKWEKTWVFSFFFQITLLSFAKKMKKKVKM